MECLPEKMLLYNYNQIKLLTSKINKYAPFGYSLSKHFPFDINKKYDFCKGEDSMKKFPADLKQHATEIINFKKKEM